MRLSVRKSNKHLPKLKIDFDATMKKTITKVSTILLLLIKTFDLVNAHSGTKGVSCHQTVTDEIVHDITCTDFSSHQQKNTISSCTLWLYDVPFYTWGWNDYAKTVANSKKLKSWVHVVAAMEPTERSCSIKAVLYDDILDALGRMYDKQKGIINSKQ